MPRRRNARQVPTCVRILCALAFYASGSYQRPTGAMTYHNVCQASMSNFIEEVTRALNHPQILSRMIHFPMTRAEREQELQRNVNFGLPRVLGLVDGTLVKIVPPPRDQNRGDYYCRKGYTALNVQIVCSTDLYIFDINARFPGSANDPYIYAASGLQAVMREAYQESRCWLLGDSIYPLEPWLHIPIPHANPGTAEYEYTRVYCSCRNPIERCNGVLKERWRCLHWDRTLHYSPVKAGMIVNACAVLHNLCKLRNIQDPVPLPFRNDNDDVENDFDQDDEEMDDDEGGDIIDNVEYPVARGVAARRRQALAEQLFLINYVRDRRAGLNDP